MSRNKADWYKGVPFGCGQCLPCRINRRRVWTLRMMLEYMTVGSGLFITLTYANEHLPLTDDGQPTLRKRDFQLFMKRFRKAVYPLKVRFFACGEYGSKTERPHYHAILFGVDTFYVSKVADAWPFGLVHTGLCTRDSIQYVAGYCLKKLVQPRNGDSRVPEFILTSRRPGIGQVAVDAIADAVRKCPEAFDIGDFANDVPGTLRFGKSNFPLGRYLIGKLRTALGVDADRENFEYIEFLRDKFFESCVPGRDGFVSDLFRMYDDQTSLLARLLMSEDDTKAAALEHRINNFSSRSKV